METSSEEDHPQFTRSSFGGQGHKGKMGQKRYPKFADYLSSCVVLSVTIIVCFTQRLHASTGGDILAQRNQNLLSSLPIFEEDILSSAHRSYDRRNQTVISPSIIVSSCKAFIDAYADAVAAFTKCSVLHARPLRFCQNCVVEYVTANAYSSVILKVGIINLCRHSY